MNAPRPAPLRLAQSGPDVSEPGRVEPSSPPSPRDAAAFERLVADHLDAAHNLAWWLTRHSEDAADIVQEACLKAWRGFADMRQDGRAWLLAIVRNTAYSRLRRPDAPGELGEDQAGGRHPGPLKELLRRADGNALSAAIEQLPAAHREVLVLCDLEGLTYAQIGLVIGAPVGTVMSRVSRARDALRRRLEDRLGKE
jgi:RNA polymerase sigma-70 factor (ECF subfamily)